MCSLKEKKETNYIENLNRSYKNEFRCPLCMSNQTEIYKYIQNIIK